MKKKIEILRPIFGHTVGARIEMDSKEADYAIKCENAKEVKPEPKNK